MIRSGQLQVEGRGRSTSRGDRVGQLRMCFDDFSHCDNSSELKTKMQHDWERFGGYKF